MTSTDARNNVGLGLRLRESMDSVCGGPGLGVPAAPGELRYAIVFAPLRACCGVFDQLAQLGIAPPIAQVGERMLFLVRPGSAAAVLDCPSQTFACAAAGIEVADRYADGMRAMIADPDLSWIVPLGRNSAAELPDASTVVTAIHAAYRALVHGSDVS